MKRSTASISSSPTTQKTKKAKFSPEYSEDETNIATDKVEGGGWTKVEKRKKKKAHKVELKLDVMPPTLEMYAY